MLIGLTIYLAGRRFMPPDSPVVEQHEKHTAKVPLKRRDKVAIIALLVLLPVLTIAFIGNQQIFNAYLVWAETHAKLPVLPFYGKQMPTTWLITVDSILSVSCLAGAVVFWRLWSKKYPEPSEIGKMTIGSFIAVTGFLSLFAGTALATKSGGQVSFGWLLGFHLPNSIGFANLFPVSLALYAESRLPHCPLPSLVSIIWLSLPRTISSAGSADFWKKCPQQISGCCTQHLRNSRYHLLRRRPVLRPFACTRRSGKSGQCVA